MNSASLFVHVLHAAVIFDCWGKDVVHIELMLEGTSHFKEVVFVLVLCVLYWIDAANVIRCAHIHERKTILEDFMQVLSCSLYSNIS